jgi:selenide,water dikinase
MALVGLPFATDVITERELSQIMAGIVQELNAAGCTLSGGHTSEMDELSVGFVVNGYLNRLRTGQAIEQGQQLILTKPIGVGVLMAAHMRVLAKGSDVSTAIGWMSQSNARAASILVSNNVTGMTDVTGFGLIGHLLRLLQPQGLGCQIGVSQVPFINGAVTLSKAGVRSSLYSANQIASGGCRLESGVDSLPGFPLLFDPQTSGGLLASVPKINAATCIHALTAAGYQAAIIGKITRANDYSVEIIDHYEQ